MRINDKISIISAVIAVVAAIFTFGKTSQTFMTNIQTIQTDMNTLKVFKESVDDPVPLNQRLISLENQKIPVGTIIAYIGKDTPTGWIKCNGQNLDPNEPKYKELIKLVGSKAPDLRGMFIRGAGQNENELYHYDGDEKRQILTPQEDMFQNHEHNHRHPITAGGLSNGSHAEGWSGSSERSIYTREDDTSATSGSRGEETRPNNYAVNFIIKY